MTILYYSNRETHCTETRINNQENKLWEPQFNENFVSPTIYNYYFHTRFIISDKVRPLRNFKIENKNLKKEGTKKYLQTTIGRSFQCFTSIRLEIYL